MNKIYRGHCFEFYSCGYHKTKAYQREREAYIGNINIDKED